MATTAYGLAVAATELDCASGRTAGVLLTEGITLRSGCDGLSLGDAVGTRERGDTWAFLR